eukprot:2621024-Pyramimonas_sp.AAC.1
MERGPWECQEALHASQHHPSKLTTRRRLDCPERRSCRARDVRKHEAFAQHQWELAARGLHEVSTWEERHNPRERIECVERAAAERGETYRNIEAIGSRR